MNLDKILVGNTDDCWPWTGQTDKYGYAKARPGHSAEHMGVHRFVYQLVYGEIPEGHTIDHLCDNKLCQNPNHLEAVPPGVNVLRSKTTQAGANARKDCCPRCGAGYELEARGDGGWKRFCRACRNAYNREWQKSEARKAYAREYQRRRRRRIQQAA